MSQKNLTSEEIAKRDVIVAALLPTLSANSRRTIEADNELPSLEDNEIYKKAVKGVKDRRLLENPLALIQNRLFTDNREFCRFLGMAITHIRETYFKDIADSHCDLKLRDLDLSGTKPNFSFSRCKLFGVNFDSADLSETDFLRAELKDCKVYGARINKSNILAATGKRHLGLISREYQPNVIGAIGETLVVNAITTRSDDHKTLIRIYLGMEEITPRMFVMLAFFVAQNGAAKADQSIETLIGKTKGKNHSAEHLARAKVVLGTLVSTFNECGLLCPNGAKLFENAIFEEVDKLGRSETPANIINILQSGSSIPALKSTTPKRK